MIARKRPLTIIMINKIFLCYYSLFLLIIFSGCSIGYNQYSISYNLNDSTIICDNHLSFPKLEYKKQNYEIVNAKRINQNKLICSYDTIISLIVEDALLSTYSFQDYSIFNFFVCLKIDSLGNVANVEVDGVIIHELINDAELEQLFVKLVSQSIKRLKFSPGRINNRNVTSCMIIKLHLDLYGSSSFRHTNSCDV